MCKYFIIALQFFIYQTLFSQSFNFKNYTIAEGLPQSTVYTIFQDSKGFIWLGTQGGVAKFNGIEFENYSQKDKLADNHVFSIGEDNQQNIWTGHRYDGISCIKKNRILVFNDQEISSSICAVQQYSKGILALTKNGILFQLELVNDTIQLINKKLLNTTTSSSFHQLKTKDNLIYVCSDEGLLEIDKNLSIKKHLFKGKKITDFCWDKERNMLLLFSNKILLTNEESVLKKINLNEKYNRIAISEKETIYLTHQSNGALIINDSRFQKLSVDNGLLSNNINTIFFDNEESLWLGFDGSGASQLVKAKFQSYGKQIGIQNNLITSLMMDSKNRMWVIGDNKSIDLIYFDSSDISRVNKVLNLNSKLKFSISGLNDVHEDHLKNIWIASNNGAYVIDSSLKISKHFTTKDGLSSDTIKSISQDINKNIWLASYTNGVSKISQNESENFEISRFFKEDGLCSNRFWTVFSASNGDVYFGSDDGGISVWKDNTFSTLGENEGLTNLRAGTITEDSEGNIWTGTIGGGIYKYDGKKFTQFNSKNGLSADNPYLVIADDFGKIWTGTNTGVDVMHQNTSLNQEINNESIFKHYGINQGFNGVETNQNAKFKDNYGRLWFGTVKGLISCQSKEIKDDTVSPILHLTGKKLFLKDEIPPLKSTFNHKENHITFDFIGLHYSNPFQVQYSYKLENFTYNDWSPWSKQKSATYANLAPGNYTFKLKAANGDNYESEIYSFDFEITAPFWKTDWFYFLSLSTILLIVYSSLSYRTLKIKRDKKILTKKVAERTTALNNEKVRVTKQKEIIEQKNKNFTDSINYAKNIQQSVLPNVKILNEFFNASFIYYNPRDIVSGDFYWFKQKGDYLVIASADCTGHGIPGALLSMLGSELLNQIIPDPSKNSPAKAIELLDKGIYDAINRSGESFQKDGIDLSLCTFNRKNNTLKFSGARRPILIYDGKDIKQFNSIPFSIGEIHTMSEKPTELEIQIEKGNRIYMFSDGYIDQFGGKRNKKFLLRRFKDKIIEMKDLPMNEQKEIFDNEFNLWKGNQEQVDDVLIIGIEI